MGEARLDTCFLAIALLDNGGDGLGVEVNAVAQSLASLR